MLVVREIFNPLSRVDLQTETAVWLFVVAVYSVHAYIFANRRRTKQVNETGRRIGMMTLQLQRTAVDKNTQDQAVCGQK